VVLHHQINLLQDTGSAIFVQGYAAAAHLTQILIGIVFK
jgi:hypothetical protein